MLRPPEAGGPAPDGAPRDAAALAVVAAPLNGAARPSNALDAAKGVAGASSTGVCAEWTLDS